METKNVKVLFCIASATLSIVSIGHRQVLERQAREGRHQLEEVAPVCQLFHHRYHQFPFFDSI